MKRIAVIILESKGDEEEEENKKQAKAIRKLVVRVYVYIHLQA